MAGRHIGFNMGFTIDDSPLTKINDKIDRTKANVKELSDLMDKTRAPSSLSNDFGKVTDASDKATQSVKRLDSATRNVSSATTGTDKIKSAMGDVESSTKRAKDATENYKQSVKQAGEASHSMGSASSAFDDTRQAAGKARGEIERTTGSSSKLKSGWDKLKGAGSELVSVGSNIAAAMVPVAGAFMEANKQAISLANEYNVIKNLQQTGGDSPQKARHETSAIRRENRRLSLKYGVNQNELAAGTEQLIRRGYSGGQDLAAHKYFLQAARASGENYNTVVAAGAPMLEQFGYKSRAGNSVKRMAKYTRDVLNKAAYVADLTAGNIGGPGGFGESFKMMGSIAHQNNQSIDTMLGALGTLSNFGQEGTQAGTGIRQIISRLIGASSSKTRTAALADLHMKPSDLFTRSGKMKPLTQIFAELNRHTRGMKQSEVSNDMQELFGQTGFNDAQILMKNYRNFQQNTRESRNAARSGYIQHLSRKNMSSLQNQLARTKALAADMGMQFARKVSPGIAKAMGFANKMLKAFMGMPGPVKKTAAYITGILGAVGGSKLISGFLKANFGIGSGKGLGGIAGQLLLGTKGKNGARTGGLINLAKQSTKFSMGKRVASGALAGGLVAAPEVFNAVRDRHSATRRSQDIGGAVGAAAGGTLTSMIPVVGPLLAPVGAMVGKYAGRWGGKAVNNFTKGWQSHKPPKKFWSLAHLGWSMHNMARQANAGFNSFTKSVGKGWNSFWGARGNDIKRMRSSIGKASSNFGKAVQRGWNSTKSFFKSLPGNAHKAWNRAMTAGHNFFKNLPKNVVNMGKTIRDKVVAFDKWYIRGWQNLFKAIGNNRYVKAFREGHLFQTAFHDMRSRWNSFSKWLGRGWNRFWGLEVKGIKHALSTIKQNWNNFWSSLPKNWNNFKTSFGKGWRSFWGGIGNFFKATWRDIKKIYDNTLGAISKGIGNVQKFFGGIGNAFNKTSRANSRSAARQNVKTANNQRAFANDIAYFFGNSKHTFKYLPSHAAGTASLVGEAGPELAYRPYARSARILGARGPQLAKIRAGERILNARDTAKVMAGGLGVGMVLKGYANGNTKIGQNADKSAKKVSTDYKKLSSDATKSLNRLNRNSKSNWSKIHSTTNKAVDSIQGHNSSTWRKIASQTDKYTNKTRTAATADYTNMRKGVSKQMDNMHDSVISTANSTAKGFGKGMDKMHSFARSAMGDTIDQLNRGTKGIDKVLSQFGGNAEVIKPVKFASGTGALLSDTLAMVNDATSGPRQEAIVRGDHLLIPSGRDRIMHLRRGDAVLNGTQTQSLAHAWGLEHFAKGSGVSHSQLRKIASRGQSNPSKSFADMFTSNIKATGEAFQKGATALGKNASTHYGNPWANAMWTVINNAIGGATGKGGTREEFLKYAEATFSGVPYQMGAASRKLSDCSGMVMQALRHFGINIGRTTVAMQHSSGVQYLGKSLSRTLPGDLVIFGHGTGAAGHVGIIKNPRTGSMFNETPPKARVTSIADDKGMGYGYYRVRGLHNAAAKTKSQKADKSLIALAKRELGRPALSWIKKHLSDDFGSLGSFAVGGDIADRARTLAKALRRLDPRATKNGIAAILGNWEFESGLNPGAINPGGGASGLGQWLGGRKSNLIAYAHRHGMSWHNAGAQLSFALKGDTGNTGILRSVLEGHGSISSLANKFSSEWERGGYNAEHVAGAEKIRRALGYAKGGNHYGSGTFLVGENGPELLSTDGKAHIDNNKETKHKLSDLFDDLRIKKPKPVKVQRPGNHESPVINININGNISSTAEAHRVANIVRVEVAKVLENIGDEFGTDPTVY